MAEITRGASRDTYIRSGPCNGAMTVWRLRDFVKTLDDAGIPDDIKIEGHRSDAGHLNSLSVRWSEKIDGWPGATDPTAPSTPEEPA